MVALKALPALYEDLANYFARQGDWRQRDQCLVLAADAALSAGMPQESERLRKRLLLTNPTHMLRPYSSMTEAMRSNDVRDYIADLRKQLPPETVEKMLNQQAPETPAAQASATNPTRPKGISRKTIMEQPPEEPVTHAAFALALVVFGVGVAIAGALAFLAIVRPMLD